MGWTCWRAAALSADAGIAASHLETPVPFREAFGDALRYWEPRRLIYNAVLLAVVVAHFIAQWPHSSEAIRLEPLLGFFILAVLANIAYCAAYIPDVLIQHSTYRNVWIRCRWVLLLIGCLFAAALAYFFALGILGAPEPTQPQ